MKSQATTWAPIGEVLRRVAGKLAAQRDKRGGHAGVDILDDVTASCPGGRNAAPQGAATGGFEDGLTTGDRDEARMKGLAARDPIQRAASAGRLRRAMQASGGK